MGFGVGFVAELHYTPGIAGLGWRSGHAGRGDAGDPLKKPSSPLSAVVAGVLSVATN